MITWLIIAGSGLDSAQAQLPMAKDAAELGYFALLEEKKLKFGINTAGEILVQPLARNGAASGQLLNVHTRIVETPPGGDDIPRGILAPSLETKDPPVARLVKTSYRGKADNDAVMETTIEVSRGVIFLGGRIIDKGKSANPQHVGLVIPMHEVYKGDKRNLDQIEDEKEKEKKEKEFVKKYRNDSISLRLADGRRLKYKMQEPIEPLNEQIKGAAVEQVELEYGAYPDHKFLFTAEPNSEIILKADQGAPLNMTLSLHWKSNPEKDPESKARLALQVK